MLLNSGKKAYSHDGAVRTERNIGEQRAVDVQVVREKYAPFASNPTKIESTASLVCPFFALFSNKFQTNFKKANLVKLTWFEFFCFSNILRTVMILSMQ